MHIRETAVWSTLRDHRPWRTVRARLTWLYGALLLASGAVLLAVTGALWTRATSGEPSVSPSLPKRAFQIIQGVSARGNASHNGAAATVTKGAAPFAQVRANVVNQLQQLATQQHGSDLHQLILYSAVALALMAVLSIALGWWTSGRILRPLRTITSIARDISATNLHSRLNLEGPDDELKELSDTIDQLLGRLERSFQAQRQFISNASHELRTPLATMRTALDVTLAKPDPVPEQTTILAERLRHELDQVDELLESFLLLARSQSTTTGEDVLVPLDLLVASATDERADALSAEHITLVAQQCPEAFVAGNEFLLARMVENVVDNAVRHNLEGGWVHVATSVEGEIVRLVVENGGPMLDGDTVQDLTEPFRRQGPARTHSDVGTGLGLSIVATIAESHGGRLRLHALPVGGLQVLIELPLAQREAVSTP
jgi:signal transduction histidine kinase